MKIIDFFGFKIYKEYLYLFKELYFYVLYNSYPTYNYYLPG